MPSELTDPGSELLLSGLALALVALAVALVVLRLAVAWRSSRRAARQRRAEAGEGDAASLLSRLGFTVVERQPTARWLLGVGDRDLEVTSRADLLVEGRGSRWIVEVKTGGQAPDPRHPATRRQLLEYLHAFEVDGALLVDMEALTVMEVTFPIDDRERAASMTPRKREVRR